MPRSRTPPLLQGLAIGVIGIATMSVWMPVAASILQTALELSFGGMR